MNYAVFIPEHQELPEWGTATERGYASGAFSQMKV
jgi:hypothetical protein